MKTFKILLIALIVWMAPFGGGLTGSLGWGEAQARIIPMVLGRGIAYGIGRTIIRRQIVGGTVRQAERILARKVQRKIGAKAIARLEQNLIRKTIEISEKRFSTAAKHMRDAIAKGHPDTLTIGRAGAGARRREALRGMPTKKGFDRDEYPPSMFAEGGKNASREYIRPTPNRACGGYFGNQCSKLADGSRIKFKVVE